MNVSKRFFVVLLFVIVVAAAPTVTLAQRVVAVQYDGYTMVGGGIFEGGQFLGPMMEVDGVIVIITPRYYITFLDRVVEEGGVPVRIKFWGFAYPPKLMVDFLQVAHQFSGNVGTEEFVIPAKFLAGGNWHRISMGGYPQRAISLLLEGPPKITFGWEVNGKPAGQNISVDRWERVKLVWKIEPFQDDSLPIVHTRPSVDEIWSDFGPRTAEGSIEFPAEMAGTFRLAARTGVASASATATLLINGVQPPPLP